MRNAKLYDRKVFLKDIGIVSLIILTPLLLYIYLIFPESNTLETPLFDLNTRYYEDLQAFIWTVSIKFTFVFMISIWYLTCRHWWRMSLLIPLVFFTNQLIVVINDELQYADQYEFGFSLVISIPLIFVLIILSKKLKYYSKTKSLAEDLDVEIEHLFEKAVRIEKKNFQQIKSEVETLRSLKTKISKDNYLKRLISLRDELS